MASTALPLSTRLSNNLKIKRNERLKKAGLGDGYEAVAPMGKQWVYLTMDIQWEVLTYAELTTIEAAIDLISPDGFFTYTLPDEATARKWRITSFDWSYYSTFVNATMSLREVFV